ncbi:MAG TPA: hypothetical protein VFE32_02780 [Puia sp.]|jgi:YHS domain-containing protein|nr:hypothetical protein [Puia sp.]
MPLTPAQQFKREFFHPSGEKLLKIFNLKKGNNFDYIYSCLAEVVSHPYVHTTIFADPFPKTFTELRRQGVIPSAGSLQAELAWNLLPIVKEIDQLNAIFQFKIKFDRHILLSEYELADVVLSEIETNYGKSLWAIENRLLLEELKSGTEANWTTLSDFASQITDGLVLYLAENFSKRIEQKIAYPRYRDIVASQMNDLVVDDNFRQYLLYKMNFTQTNQYPQLDYFLAFESTSSLFDRYLVLRTVLGVISTPDNEKLARRIVQKLRNLQDPLLNSILNKLQVGNFNVSPLTEKALDLFDRYTSGDYEQCMSLIPATLTEAPNSIELYDLYAKSNIELGEEFKPPSVSPLVDTTIALLYRIYKRDDSSSSATEELFKIIIVHFSADWAKQLYALVSSLTNTTINETLRNQYYLLFSVVNNPKSLRDFEATLPNSNLVQLSKLYPDRLSLRVLNAIHAGDAAFFTTEKGITDLKKEAYRIKALYNGKQYSMAIEMATQLFEKQPTSYIYEETLYILFRSCLQLNKIQEALLLFVDHYISNPFMVKRLDVRQLSQDLDTNLQQVADKIEYPIFVTTQNRDDYTVYVAYDSFLSALGIEKPSQIHNLSTSFPAQKLILFYRDVCKFEVLKYSFYFENKADLEKERLSLLDELLKLDKKNESIYISEMTSLTQNAAIKKTINEVNKAKISINIEQLRLAVADNIRDGFSRYVELATFSRNRAMHGIDVSGKQLSQYFRDINNELKTKIVYTNDPAFISFKVMLIEIRDKFLFSKEYGLDGYLSTRIRHGTFQNYIRSVFEVEMLISQKNKDGDYLDIEYWADKLPNRLANQKTDLQTAIHTFSKQIDEYTEYILKELLQVKTEKNDRKASALFDYRLSSHELGAFFYEIRDQIRDHKAFVSIVFDYLLAKTDQILKNIKAVLSHEVLQGYTTIINSFQDTITSIVGRSFTEMTTAIKRCNTHLQKEIESINEWFSISAQTDSVVDLSTILGTAIQITNRIYPYKQINPKISLGELPIYGSINLVYVARILLDNIIQHSRISPSDLEIKISAEYADDVALIKFTNNLSPTVDLDYLRMKLEDVKSKWTQMAPELDKTDTEGGSGFNKIRRILYYDMNQPAHGFDYSIEDGELTIIILLKIIISEN